MTTGKLLKINTPELIFPFQLNKEIPCSILLSNKTDNYVAFKFVTTAINHKYVTRPNREVILPRSACEVQVIMQRQRTAPSSMRSKDRVIVKSIVTFAGVTRDDIEPEWFTKNSCNTVDEVKLRVVYVSPTSIDRSIDLKLSTVELLEITPPKLQFPFELNKQISCSICLSNKSNDHIAFKVLTSNWPKYTIQPSMAILLPQSTCKVVVIMKAQRKAPPNMRCEDLFAVQSVVTFGGATVKDITHDMFFKELGKTVDETNLEAVYVSPFEPPSPNPERCDKGSSYRASASATLQKFGNMTLDTTQDDMLTQAFQPQGIEDTPLVSLVSNRMTIEQWRQIIKSVAGPKPIKKERKPLSSVGVSEPMVTPRRQNERSLVIAQIAQYVISHLESDMVYDILPTLMSELDGAQTAWDVAQRITTSLVKILPKDIYVAVSSMAFTAILQFNVGFSSGEAGGDTIVGSSRSTI